MLEFEFKPLEIYEYYTFFKYTKTCHFMAGGDASLISTTGAMLFIPLRGTCGEDGYFRKWIQNRIC